MVFVVVLVVILVEDMVIYFLDFLVVVMEVALPVSC